MSGKTTVAFDKLNDTQLDELKAFASSRGITIRSIETEAPDLCDEFASWSHAENPTYVASCARGVVGTSIETLGYLTIRVFIQRFRSRPFLMSRFLEFMITQGMKFADFNPAIELRTPMDDLDLDRRITNKLSQHGGIKWLEFLLLHTEAELSDVEHISDHSVGRIVAWLRHRGLAPYVEI